jgi:hypothetical protein
MFYGFVCHNTCYGHSCSTISPSSRLHWLEMNNKNDKRKCPCCSCVKERHTGYSQNKWKAKGATLPKNSSSLRRLILYTFDFDRSAIIGGCTDAVYTRQIWYVQSSVRERERRHTQDSSPVEWCPTLDGTAPPSIIIQWRLALPFTIHGLPHQVTSTNKSSFSVCGSV